MATHWVLDRMAGFRDRPALVWRGAEVTYARILDGALAWSRRLDEQGVARGESVAVVGDYSPESVALLLALIAHRSVAVPLTRGVPSRERLFAIAEVRHVFELDEADGWTASRRDAEPTAPLLRELRERAEPGLVLFSSGTTGKSKAILHGFDRLLEKFRRTREPTRSLVFLLLDHIGGINTLLGILTSGGTAVSIAERTPAAVARAIERWRVEVLPTSPTFLNMLLMSRAHESHDLSSLRVVTYGTEPMPASTLERVAAAFPDARIKQTYGLSEVGILPTRSPERGSLLLELGGEGFETKVQGGTLWIRSASAMCGYLDHPSPFDADGWLDTGDLVEVEGDRVRILGRKTDVINVGGEKVTPSEVESTILEMDNVRDVTVRGRPNAVTGNVVVARVSLFEPEDPERLRARVQEFCRARLARYKVPLFVEVGDEQHNARFKKIRQGG